MENQVNVFTVISTVFTVIGGVFGVILFYNEIKSQIYKHNKEKLEKLSSIINFIDFDNLCNGAEGGRIYSDEYEKFSNFIYNIKAKTEVVQFKGSAKINIDKKFQMILEEEKKFRDEVKVPKWEIGKCNTTWRIDKEYFKQNFESPKVWDNAIINSMDNAYNPLLEINRLYGEIFKLANKLPLEINFKHLICKLYKMIKIPYLN